MKATDIDALDQVTFESWRWGMGVFVLLIPAIASAALFAAVLPTSRSATVGNTVTAFATMINAGAETVTDCRITLATPIAAEFSYNSVDNPNTPANLDPGASHNFVVSVTPTQAFSAADIGFSFDCANAEPAVRLTGLNTLLVSSSHTPVADIVALAATVSGDGIVDLDRRTGAGSFSVATVNLGVSDQIHVSADTGDTELPLSLTLCQTDPVDGHCLSEISHDLITPIGAGATPTFGIFGESSELIEFDPARKRIFVRFRGTDGQVHGATSVALQTLATELAVKNVLMIAVDDLRPQLGSYGQTQMVTPNIDQLAAVGYQFNRAYVQQALCSPSRTSIMTGMRPNSTQVFDLVTNFRDTIPWVETLPQYMRRYGYYTAGIGKIYHNHNLNDELSWSEPWPRASGIYGWALQKNIDLRNTFGKGPPYENADVPDNVYHDGAITDSAIAKLVHLKDRQPFFYSVGYIRPHLPFSAPKTYWDLYDANSLVLPYTRNPAQDASSYAYTEFSELRGYYGMPATGPVTAEQERLLVHGYYASVSYIDAQIGRLIAALEAEGLAESTAVVLWGDHGWHLGNQGQWGKSTNFERATRIPLIIKVPWMPGNNKIDALVEAVDLYPTILALCGVPAPPHLEGDSLVPLLENPSLPGAESALSQFPRSRRIMGYSMRTDRYRYTEWRKRNSNTLVERELFDHDLDPGEDTNVASRAEYAAVAENLAAQLEALLQESSPETAVTADAEH